MYTKESQFIYSVTSFQQGMSCNLFRYVCKVQYAQTRYRSLERPYKHAPFSNVAHCETYICIYTSHLPIPTNKGAAIGNLSTNRAESLALMSLRSQSCEGYHRQCTFMYIYIDEYTLPSTRTVLLYFGALEYYTSRIFNGACGKGAYKLYLNA